MLKNLCPFPSLPSLTLLILFLLFHPTERRGFSTSLDRLTNALQVNSNARRGFQPFAITLPKVMMNNYRKMFWNTFSITTFAPEFSCQLLQSFLQALSSSEGLKNAELGWAEAGKLYSQAAFLLSHRSSPDDPRQANHTPFPYQFQFPFPFPVPEQREPLPSVMQSHTYCQ